MFSIPKRASGDAFRPAGAIGAAVTAAALFLVSSVQAQPLASKPPAFTAAQAKRGAQMYVGQCAMCHGEGLDDGEFAPALKGPPYAEYWSGRTAADVLSYINSMMPPSQPGALGAQGAADVLAYMLQSNGAPAADKELPADSPALAGMAPHP